MLSLFANLIYYFPGDLTLPHIDELGMSRTRAGRAPDEWGEEPAQNIITIIIVIIIIFFFSLFFEVCV